MSDEMQMAGQTSEECPDTYPHVRKVSECCPCVTYSQIGIVPKDGSIILHVYINKYMHACIYTSLDVCCNVISLKEGNTTV